GEAEPAGGRQERASALLRVGADDGRQTGDRSDRLPPLAAPGHPEADPDVRRARPAVEMGKSLDVGDREPRDLRDPARGEAREHVPLQLAEADRLASEITAVSEPV